MLILSRVDFEKSVDSLTIGWLTYDFIIKASEFRDDKLNLNFVFSIVIDMRLLIINSSYFYSNLAVLVRFNPHNIIKTVFY